MKQFILSFLFLCVGVTYSLAADERNSKAMGGDFTGSTILDDGNIVREIGVRVSTHLIALSTSTNGYEEDGWRFRMIVNNSTCAAMNIRFSPSSFDQYSSTYGVRLGSTSVDLSQRTFTYRGQAELWGVWSEGCSATSPTNMQSHTGAGGMEGYYDR